MAQAILAQYRRNNRYHSVKVQIPKASSSVNGKHRTALNADAVEYIPPSRIDRWLEHVRPPPGLEGHCSGKGLEMHEIESRLREGCAQAAAEGRTCSPDTKPVCEYPPGKFLTAKDASQLRSTK